MNLLKIMPTALLLTLSLGAYAQDEDELLDDAANEDSTEVLVPTTPTDKKTFHRVQIGYTGTIAKYTDHGESIDYNSYFLSGLSVGWMGDLRIAKKIGLFLELGANLTYHMGGSKDDRTNTAGDESYHYKVKAFTLTIPVSINKQFKGVFGVKDLTLAPYIGAYARFNVMAKRTATATNADGTEKTYTTSIMNVDTEEELADFGESRFYMAGFTRKDKLHTGRLLQVGAQVGVNAYYKRYYFGLAYMHDLTPFAKHVSEDGLTSKSTPQGGNLPSRGTGCDMEISTRHNFALSFGYIF